MSSNATPIGALLRLRLSPKGYNLGVSKSTNGAGIGKRRRMPSLLLPKPQEMKMKDASNNSRVLPNMPKSEAHTKLRKFKSMIKFAALFNPQPNILINLIVL